MQEQENTFQPAERFILTSVGAVKAFSDSLRLRMLETLMDAPHTVKELARLLDVPQKKLYYHR